MPAEPACTPESGCGLRFLAGRRRGDGADADIRADAVARGRAAGALDEQEIADGEFGKRDLPATFPDARAPVDGQLRAAGLWLKLVPLPNRTIVRSSSGSSPSSIERWRSREWENCCMRNTSLRASRSSTTGSPL